MTIRQLHAREHSATTFASQCVYGLLICGGPALANLGAMTPAAWAVLAAASVSAGAGQLFMTRAYRDLPVAEGSLLQMLVPLGIAIGGVVFFHEQHSGIELLGGALILAGTAATAMLARLRPA